MPWPLPAAAAWATGWAVLLLAQWSQISSPVAPIVAMLAAGAVAWVTVHGRLRLAVAGLGFPLSALVLGAATAPAWAWLLLLAPLLAAYPLRAWRDAPFFPSPAYALDGVGRLVRDPPRRVLDAGCGMGHGLQAMHRVWPGAALTGLEWSLPLTLLARVRCRATGAKVRRGDMWRASWAEFDLIYLFQRPESMARVFAKALADRPDGGWLLSLEFEVPGDQARRCLQGCLHRDRRRALWIYRLPANPRSSGADSTDGAQSPAPAGSIARDPGR